MNFKMPLCQRSVDIKTLQSASTQWNLYFLIDTVWMDQGRFICNVKKKIPFPEPVNMNVSGQIPGGRPRVAISSPTEITAAFAAAKEGYM